MQQVHACAIHDWAGAAGAQLGGPRTHRGEGVVRNTPWQHTISGVLTWVLTPPLLVPAPCPQDGVEGAGKGMFGVLNEHWPGIADGLLAKHREVDAKARAVDDAVASGDVAAVQAAWGAFMPSNEDHLAAKEDIMMQMVMKEWGGTLPAVMKTELLSCAVATGDMDFFIAFAMRMSERHPGGGKPRKSARFDLSSDATPQSSPDRTRDGTRALVWSRALSAVATDEQWAQVSRGGDEQWARL